MAWDSRGYYYQSKRINGQPRSVYVGAGLLAELTARVDAQEQAQKAAQDAQRRLLRAQDRAILKDLDSQYAQLRTFVGELLTAAGYYQHNRGEWRKMGKKAAELTGPVDDGAPVDVEALVARINRGNPKPADLDALRQVLDTQGGGDRTGVPTALGGLAVLDHVLEKWAGGNNAAAKMIMEADARRMEKTLGRDSAPPFERPLIDHIVVCWVRLQLVERNMSNATSGAHSPETGAYWDRRLSEAQRRYLRAVNLLAKLRHTAPAVQVNVAHQQIVQNTGK